MTSSFLARLPQTGRALRARLQSQACTVTAVRRVASEAGRDAAGEESTHFGFATVDKGDKEDLVAGVFHNVASKYDVMNDAMSVGVHRLWKDHFVRSLAPSAETRLLDVAGGTGDIALRVLEAARKAPVLDHDAAAKHDGRIIVCDINGSMVEQGKQRATKLGVVDDIDWMVGNAECLPIESCSVDAYTIAFGIRNVTQIDKALEEAHRVLVPGGRFMCLEFSHVPNPAVRTAYDAYSFQIIPVLGEILAGDMASYQYLVESIRQFPDQQKFAGMIRAAGFSHVTYENLTFGVAAIHSGFKL